MKGVAYIEDGEEMEIIGWIFGTLSIIGGLWTLIRNPRFLPRLLGLLPILGYLVSMTVVARGWSDAELITLPIWLVFWLILPIVSGVTGLVLITHAERSRSNVRMEQVMNHWRAQEPKGPYR
jgi:hypothetical protein